MTTTPSEPGHLVVTLFGPPRAESDGRPVEVDTRKALALLAYLALSEGSHRRDRLAGLLWPEYDEVHARAALRRTLSVLNKALGGRGLEIERTKVGLDRAHMWLDVAEFRRLRSLPAAHDHGGPGLCDECLGALRRAVALQSDDFLAGFALRDSAEFDEWQSWQAETLRRELASVLDDLVRALETAGRFDEAIASARRRLHLDPLSEPTHRELMRLFARAGERGAALTQYRACVSILERELGVAPLSETAELYEAIREGEGLEPPPSPAPRAPEAQRTSRTVAEMPLVGRDEELSTALAAYDARAGDGFLVVVEGEAGIGKTRLALELSRALGARGATVAASGGREGESHIALGVVAELLRASTSSTDDARDRLARIHPSHLAEAARLLPELGLVHGQQPPPLEGPGAHARMLEGLAEVLCASVAGPVPGVLVVDDLHWADPSSIEAIAYLVRRLSTRPVCVVAAWRAEEMARDNPLLGLVAEAARRREATILAPGRLTRADVATLASNVSPDMDGRAADELAGRLFAESEGSPLFLAEYLAGLDVGDHIDGGLPRGIRALLSSRVGSVDERSRQLLGAAAVLGRSFDYDTLKATAGRDEDETVASLETLVGRGLIREEAVRDEGGAGYDFTHDKIRSFVYEEMGLARRRLLHRRAAAALVGRGRPGPPDGSLHGVVATHLDRAGDEAGAAAHHRLAGEHAASLHAHAEALAHFEAALAAEGGGAPDLHEAIGDLHTLQGDYGAALTSLETAAALAGEPRLARLEHKLGNVHHRRGHWLAADSHYEAALETGVDEILRARVLADRSLTAHRKGDTPAAHAHARAALAVADATGDGRALAQGHNVLGSIAAHLGEVGAARRHLERSLELAEASADRGAQVAALNNLGLVLRRTGDAGRALEVTERALALSEQTGDRHHLAALHNNVADLLHDLGRAEDAMAHLKHAVAIFSDIGGDELEPEIWKLTQW